MRQKLDDVLSEIEEHKKILSPMLIDLKKVDDSIEYFENRLKEAEKIKQIKLKAINDIFELTALLEYSLPCGYKVKMGNKYKVDITSMPEFLKWLKANLEPQEVLRFFDGALKDTYVKNFASEWINRRKMKGEIDVKIDGLNIEGLTYRRLTTKKGD